MTWTRPQLAHPERADAFRLLTENGIGVRRVFSVDIDSILFEDKLGRPMTAWIRREGEAVFVKTEAGFVA